MRVADLDVLYNEMQEELNEMAIGDEFKSGFLYAMGIVKRERGIKIPVAHLDGTHIHSTTLELNVGGDGE